MSDTQRSHAAPMLLAELPDGGTVDLVPMADAAQQLSDAMKRIPGDALCELAKRVRAGSMVSCRLRGPNQYAEWVTGATVWEPGRRGEPGHFEFVRNKYIPSRWDGEPVRRWIDPIEARPAVVGPAGLANGLERCAALQNPLAHVAALRAAVRSDELRALVVELTQRRQAATARPAALGRTATRCGLAETEAGTYVPVVSLTSLAECLADAMPAPPKHARAELLRRLAADSAPLFLMDAGCEDAATLVPEEYPWRPAMPSGAVSWRTAELDRLNEASAGLVFISPNVGYMDGTEAVLRGVCLDAENPDWGANLRPDDWRALPALPALTGRAGALEAFELCAAKGAEHAAPELVGKVRALAMFEADAHRVFPELAPVRSFWEGELQPMRAALPGPDERPFVQVERAAATAGAQARHAEADELSFGPLQAPHLASAEFSANESDDVKFGPLQAGPGEANRLVSMVALVRHVGEVQDIPPVPAWAEVRRVLDEAGPVSLYLRRPRDFADALAAGAAFRHPNPGRRVRGSLVTGQWNPRPTVPVLDWVGMMLQGDDRQTYTQANRIAVLASDAQRLFGYGEATTAAEYASAHAAIDSMVANAPPPDRTLRAVDGSASEAAANLADLRSRVHAHQPIKRQGPKWGTGELAKAQAELLRQYEERQRLPEAVAAIIEENLADLWGLKKNTVHVYLTQARKARAAAIGAAEAKAAKRA